MVINHQYGNPKINPPGPRGRGEPGGSIGGDVNGKYQTNVNIKK